MMWPFKAVFKESSAIATENYNLKNGDTITSAQKIWTNLKIEGRKPTKKCKAYLGEFQNNKIIRGEGTGIALPLRNIPEIYRIKHFKGEETQHA